MRFMRKEGEDIIDSHSSRKRRAHVRIKARRDRAWTNRDSVLLVFFFISFRDAPLCRSSMLLRRRTAVIPHQHGETTFSFRSRAAARIGITRTVDARCTRMHAPSLRIASERRAPMRTNNFTPRGGFYPPACCSFSRN